MTARCPYGLAAVLAMCACVIGCDRAQERASAAPASDPEPEAAAAAPSVAAPAAAADADPRQEAEKYAEVIRNASARNAQKQKDLAYVQRRLRAVEERARAALPAGATPEQVRNEIERNPKKYRDYWELQGALAERQAEVKKSFSQAQNSIRAHHAQRKPAEGRAQGAAAATK